MSDQRVGSDEWMESLSFEERLAAVKVWAMYADQVEGYQADGTLFHLRWLLSQVERLLNEDSRRATIVKNEGTPGKRYSITDEHLKQIVKVYVEAEEIGTPPTRAVAYVFQVSHSTAAKWVGHARKRGLLDRWANTDSVRMGRHGRRAAS